MKILIAGGVFRLQPEQLKHRQPAPEVVLSEGLRNLGFDVDTMPLERWKRIAVSGSYDIVHIHHLSKAALAAALSPFVRPFVFTEHASGHPGRADHRVAQRAVMAKASTVVCLSQAEANAKRAAYGLGGSKIAVIPNGIKLATKARTPLLNVPNEPIVLLFVGQLKAVKQVHRIIDALPHLPDRFVVRIVYHNNEGEQQLRDQVRALGVEGRVSFVGQRANEGLVAEYMRAHMLLLPSASEALPSVVTEALLTGLPVVASAVGGIPEQIGDAGILVSPLPQEPLAPAILNLMANYPDYARRADSRSREIAEEFSISEMIQRHTTLYESLLRGPSQ